MGNPFKSIKKKIDTKLKKAAVTATLIAVLTWASVQFNVPVAKDVIESVAAALSDVVVSVLDAPVNPPADAPALADSAE